MVNGRGRDITDRDMIAAVPSWTPARGVRSILRQIDGAIAALPAVLAEVSG